MKRVDYAQMAEAARREWKDMPEFEQDKQRPFAQIVVRFSSPEDLEEFAFLIGQELTNKTKSIWHPKLAKTDLQSMQYIDSTPNNN